MARVKSGEIGVHYDGREFIFRPSFARLDALAQDYDLRALWGDLQGSDASAQVAAATAVLGYLFAGSDSDLELLIGYTMPINGWRWDYPGVIPPDEQGLIAFTILRNGLIGNPDIRSAKSSESGGGDFFNAYDYVFSAVKKLNMSKAEAEQLTMAEFQQALLIAYPDQFRDYERENAETEALLKSVGMA